MVPGATQARPALSGLGLFMGGQTAEAAWVLDKKRLLLRPVVKDQMPPLKKHEGIHNIPRLPCASRGGGSKISFFTLRRGPNTGCGVSVPRSARARAISGDTHADISAKRLFDHRIRATEEEFSATYTHARGRYGNGWHGAGIPQCN